MGLTSEAEVWQCDAEGCANWHAVDVSAIFRGPMPHVPPGWLLVIGYVAEREERPMFTYCSPACLGVDLNSLPESSNR